MLRLPEMRKEKKKKLDEKIREEKKQRKRRLEISFARIKT